MPTAPQAFNAVVVLLPVQTLKQIRRQSHVLKGWIERQMIMVWGSTPAGPDRVLSVYPTLCDKFLESKCRLLRSESVHPIGSYSRQSQSFVVIQPRPRIHSPISQLRPYKERTRVRM